MSSLKAKNHRMKRIKRKLNAKRLSKSERRRLKREIETIRHDIERDIEGRCASVPKDLA